MSEDQDQGGQQPVDDDEGVRFNPPITSTTHILPFERLSPLDFERLCLWLVEREGCTHAEHLGLAGSEQGRDVIAYRPTSQGEELWYFQCKRYRYIRAKTLKDEVDKYLKLAQEKPHLKPFGVVFVVSCAVSADAREEVGAYCEQHNLAPEFWALTELDLRVKRHPDLLREFFGLYARPIGVPFQAPPLPAHFVPRPEVSQALKAHLLADETTTPGVLVVSAVHGLGGIGKTTLVAHLACDPDIQARFPDGVLWATLGQHLDVLSLLAGWIQTLGDYDFHPTTIEMATPHLRTLLHDKACLLVVDDVWQADQTRAFLVGGERCQVLITTRDATLARKVSARLYDLDVMTEEQALALFEARLGPLDGNREQAATLAHELGYLPLALELAAAQVEAGVTWVELLETFSSELADLAALDLDDATYRNESLRLSFRMSLERLSPEDQEAFARLGVLPEDARLNPAMAATLWDQPETEARKQLRRLRDKALLKPVGEDRYTLHDLLHDEAKLRLAERTPLPEGHAAFLARYEKKVPDEQWDRLPDDGYIHEHLTWHMEHAEQAEAIHSLLREETSEGCNAWYEARERLGQIPGYLNDIRRAWQMAEHLPRNPQLVGLQCRYALIAASLNSLADSIPPTLLSELVDKGAWTPEQGLIYASQVLRARRQGEALVALAHHLPEPLLRKALAVAQRIESERVRSEVLVGLAPHLPELLLREALAATLEIKNSVHRVTVLVGLASHLPEPLLQEALAAAWEINDGFECFRVLVGLAPHLPEPLLREALAVAQKIRSKQARFRAMIELAPHLPESLRDEALQDVAMAAQGTESRRAPVRALVRLAPHLPKPLSRETLAAAWDTSDTSRISPQALIRLLPRLAQFGCAQEALATAQTLESEQWRTAALVKLAPHLPEPLLQEALMTIQTVESEQWRTKALVGLAPHLPEPLLQEALVTIQTVESEQWRTKALVGLAPHLPEPLLREALTAAREIDSDVTRARALIVLALHLPEAERRAILQEALAAAEAVQSRHWRADALAELAPHLPALEQEKALREALAAAREISRKEDRVKALMHLAPHLPQPVREQTLQEALGAAIAIDDDFMRTWALGILAPYLPKALLQQELVALVRKVGIRDEDHQADALIDLATLLPKLEREKALRETLVTVRAIRNADHRADALTNLAAHLPKLEREGLIQEALVTEPGILDGWSGQALARLAPYLPEALLREDLAAARKIERDETRVKTLAALVPHLPETERDEALQEVLAAARELPETDRRGGSPRAEVLVSLAPRLPESERERALREALAATRQIRDERPGSSYQSFGPHSPPGDSELAQRLALVRLAPQLSESLLEEALAAALALRNERHHAYALAQLAPHLPEALLRGALVAAKGIRAEDGRAKALTGLAPHLPESIREPALQEALAAARGIRRNEDRVKALMDLAPHLPESIREPALQEALEAAWEISQDKDRVKALIGLALHLPEPKRERVLQKALMVAQELPAIDRAGTSPRGEALMHLAPHLPQPMREQALREALAAARGVSEWSYFHTRAQVLKDLASRLTSLPCPELTRLWLEVRNGANLLHFLACRTRQSLLSDLAALAPVIHKLGGEEAIAETFHAIQDVGRWWP